MVLISSFDAIFFSSFCFVDNLITDEYSLLFLKALPWSYVMLLNFYSTLVSGRHFQVMRQLWQPCTALHNYLSLSCSQQKIVREVFQLKCVESTVTLWGIHLQIFAITLLLN
jgi:hypothetical protein